MHFVLVHYMYTIVGFVNCVQHITMYTIVGFVNCVQQPTIRRVETVSNMLYFNQRNLNSTNHCQWMKDGLATW